MKTTFDLPDDLVIKIKKIASSKKTTLRSLVILGLEAVLNSDSKNAEPKLKEPVVFGGDGYIEGVDASNWQQIRQIAYEGRGE